MRSLASHNLSLSDLAVAGLRLRPIEAVTITRELILRAHRGELPGIPTASLLRFTNEGETICEGPVAAGQSVERAGRLLDALLPGFDAPPEFKAAGALRLVVARALATLDLPAYRTLDEFAEALARFAAEDPKHVVQGLVQAWRVAVDRAGPDNPDIAAASTDSLELTISDVRRARRSTGLRLADIAERSRIPISRLRELEWGYFANWPTGSDGRSQLVRYARSAGLDVDVVTNAVWPVLDQSVRARAATVATVAPTVVLDGDVLDEPVGEVSAPGTNLVPFNSGPVAPVQQEDRRRPLWLAALAIPALIAIGLIPAVWQSVSERSAEAPGGAAPTAVATSASAGSGSVRTPVTPPVSTPAPDPGPARPSAVTPAATVPASTGAARDLPAPTPDRQPVSTDGPDRAELSGGVAYSPAFASAGSAMFYHADAGDRSAIMRADTDTSGTVLRVTSIVDDEARNFHARPSPDGALIAFDSDRDGERAVYVADARGENVRRISGEGFAAVPSWSPDGRTLAFVRAEANRPRVWNLWTADLKTGTTRRLTSHRVGQPWGAAWFPDGRRIAYSHEERLVVRSLEDGRERVYNTPRKGHLIRTPAVSPDGRRVMFQVHKDGAWMLDLADGSMRRVLTDPTAEEFTWSPDGRRVAYHSRKVGGWGVWVMAAR